MDLRVNSLADDPTAELVRGIKASVQRVSKLADGELDEKAVQTFKNGVEGRLRAALTTDKWKGDFRGRDILAEFGGRHLSRLGYEAFRDLIIARMIDDKFQPEGMKRVLTSIGAT